MLNAAGPPNKRLPSFNKPPLVEVVCGVQFSPIAGWLTSHCGLFWNEIRAEYPLTEDHPPVAKLKLGEFEEQEELAIAPLPPIRRVFFVHSSEAYLIQVQQNRFLHNWRKVNETDDYPRFDAAYGRFIEQWDRFKSFLKSVGLSEPRIEAFELTYVNVIGAPDATFPKDIWRFLNFYSHSPLTASGSTPRAVNLNVGWPLDREAGKLSLSVKHGKRTADALQDLLIAEFAAKGAAHLSATKMEAWFAAAHEAIVTTFAALTTDEAHRLWERVE